MQEQLIFKEILEIDEVERQIRYFQMVNQGIPTVEDRDVSYLLKPYEKPPVSDMPF